jgi:hypothetical protein
MSDLNNRIGMASVIESEFYLGRQPIEGHSWELFGYEVLIGSRTDNGAAIVDDIVARATVIAHTFSSLGMQSATGGKTTFHKSEQSLADGRYH